MKLRWHREPERRQAGVWLSTVVYPALLAGAPKRLREIDSIAITYWANARQIARYLPAFASLLDRPIVHRRRRLLRALDKYLRVRARCPTCGMIDEP